MSTMLYLSFVLLGWLVFELYLQWINYKGRFRYKLLEENEWKRKLQNRVGLLSLPISSLFKFVLMLIFSALPKLIFNLSDEVVLVSVVSGFLGFTVANASFDKYSVEAFEKFCLICVHNKECSEFLDRICLMKFLKHRVKMAVLANKKESI